MMYNRTVVFPFEADFDPLEKREWMLEHRHEASYYCGIYMALMLGCQFYMKSRQPHELRFTIAAWNACMAVFSILGLSRTLPELLHALNKFGFSYTVCNPSFIVQDQVTAFWAWMLTGFKFIQFLDTMIILVRRHKLIILHWYRQLALFLFTWYCYSEHVAAARWFVTVSYFAYSLMYTYYTLYVMNIQVPKLFLFTVTSSQILQAQVGFGVSYFAFNALRNGQICQFPKYLAFYGMFTHASILGFFAWYFYRKFEIKTINGLVTERGAKQVDWTKLYRR